MQPSITLVGNIGKIEASYTPGGKLVCKGSLAVTVGYGDNKDTDWYNFVAWEKTGTRLNDWCKVGTRIHVAGTLRLRKWTDNGGVNHISNDVTVSSFEVLSKGKDRNEDTETNSLGGEEPDFMQD